MTFHSQQQIFLSLSLSLFLLPSLTLLQYSANVFQSLMPTLGKLYLDNNELTGTVPIELGGLGTYRHIILRLFLSSLAYLLLYDCFTLFLVLTIRIASLFVLFHSLPYIALQLYLLNRHTLRPKQCIDGRLA